jgi:hypothetical protein
MEGHMSQQSRLSIYLAREYLLDHFREIREMFKEWESSKSSEKSWNYTRSTRPSRGGYLAK